MSDISKSFKSLPSGIKIALYLGAGAGVFFIGRKIYKDAKAKSDLEKRLKEEKQSEKIVTIIDSSTGTGVTTTLNLSSIADAINDSIDLRGTYFQTEDETRMVNEIKKVPKAYINELKDLYKTRFGYDLQQDLISSLDSDEWDKISDKFS